MSTKKIGFKPMTEDPLEFMLNLSMYKFFLANTVLLYVISFSICFSFQIFIPIYVYEVWYTGHMSDNIGYIVTFLLMQPFVSVLFILPIYMRRLGNFPSYIHQHYGSLKTDDAVFNKTIEQEIKKTMIICIFTFMFETFAVLAVITSNNINIGKDIVFLTAFADKYFLPAYVNILRISLYVLAVIMAYLFMFPMWFLSFTVVHTLFQVRLLIFYLTKNASELKTDLERSMIDIDYQNHIYEILRFCVKHHIHLKTFHHSYMTIIHFPILLLSFSSGIGIIAALYFIISGASPEHNFAICSSMMTVLLFYFSYCYYGQLLIDESEKFYESLCDTPWNYWNKKNRQILIMMLINARQPFEVTCYDLASLNYALTLSAFRFCYSIFALVVNVF